MRPHWPAARLISESFSNRPCLIGPAQDSVTPGTSRRQSRRAHRREKRPDLPLSLRRRGEAARPPAAVEPVRGGGVHRYAPHRPRCALSPLPAPRGEVARLNAEPVRGILHRPSAPHLSLRDILSPFRATGRGEPNRSTPPRPRCALSPLPAPRGEVARLKAEPVRGILHRPSAPHLSLRDILSPFRATGRGEPNRSAPHRPRCALSPLPAPRGEVARLKAEPVRGILHRPSAPHLSLRDILSPFRATGRGEPNRSAPHRPRSARAPLPIGDGERGSQSDTPRHKQPADKQPDRQGSRRGQAACVRRADLPPAAETPSLTLGLHIPRDPSARISSPTVREGVAAKRLERHRRSVPYSAPARTIARSWAQS
jgi:hypothetical protein